jgi:uncharacterized 2Fe-2S/4Fe-4S cluster protein (DUF4445 family)
LSMNLFTKGRTLLVTSPRTRVRKMLRSNMNEYKEIAKAVSRVEVYKDAFAISIFNGDDIANQCYAGKEKTEDILADTEKKIFELVIHVYHCLEHSSILPVVEIILP